MKERWERIPALLILCKSSHEQLIRKCGGKAVTNCSCCWVKWRCTQLFGKHPPDPIRTSGPLLSLPSPPSPQFVLLCVCSHITFYLNREDESPAISALQRCKILLLRTLSSPGDKLCSKSQNSEIYIPPHGHFFLWYLVILILLDNRKRSI